MNRTVSLGALFPEIWDTSLLSRRCLNALPVQQAASLLRAKRAAWIEYRLGVERLVLAEPHDRDIVTAEVERIDGLIQRAEALLDSWRAMAA